MPQISTNQDGTHNIRKKIKIPKPAPKPPVQKVFPANSTPLDDRKQTQNFSTIQKDENPNTTTKSQTEDIQNNASESTLLHMTAKYDGRDYDDEEEEVLNQFESIEGEKNAGEDRITIVEGKARTSESSTSTTGIEEVGFNGNYYSNQAISIFYMEEDAEPIPRKAY